MIYFMDPIETVLGFTFVAVSIAWYLFYVRSRVVDTSALAVMRNPETVESEVDMDGDAE